ncbi:MAG: sugar phosphate nucleotidyltransferase [bacterium]|nr:sugar phosphate nucleotidyltransferase [bacterium]
MAAKKTASPVRRAVILAGGRGARLRPFTFAFPKPLVPIGDVPIIDIVMQQLQAAGIEHVTLAVGHLAELLMAYFSHRTYEGMVIDYSREDEPLGTAGPLSLVEDLNEPFLVLNGDLLTSLDFADLAEHHVRSGAMGTIASYTKAYQVDLGILDVDEQGHLTAYHEKPTYSYRVSMGIYVFQPEVLSLLKKDERCDLPSLAMRIVEMGRKLVVFPFDGYWVDIGSPEEYARAVDEFEKHTPPILKGTPRRDKDKNSN